MYSLLFSIDLQRKLKNMLYLAFVSLKTIYAEHTIIDWMT